MVIIDSSIDSSSYNDFLAEAKKTTPNFSKFEGKNFLIENNSIHVSSTSSTATLSSKEIRLGSKIKVLIFILSGARKISYSISPVENDNWFTVGRENLKFTLLGDARTWSFQHSNSGIKLYYGNSEISNFGLNDSLLIDFTDDKTAYGFKSDESSNLYKISKDGNITSLSTFDTTVDATEIYAAKNNIYAITSPKDGSSPFKLSKTSMTGTKNEIDYPEGSNYLNLLAVNDAETNFFRVKRKVENKTIDGTEKTVISFVIEKLNISQGRTNFELSEITNPNEPKSLTLDNNTIGASDTTIHSTNVTDIAYANGYLWGLVQIIDRTFTTDKQLSKGALLKIDTQTMSCVGIYGLTSSENPGQDSSGDSNKLYGPIKFLAIKPEEFLIADDGGSVIPIPRDKDGNTHKVIQKNRVVIFNLSNSELTSFDTNVEFLNVITGSGSYIK